LGRSIADLISMSVAAITRKSPATLMSSPVLVLHAAEHVDVLHVGVGDAGDGDVVDVQLVPLEQVEQEVERAVEDVEFDAVVHAADCKAAARESTGLPGLRRYDVRRGARRMTNEADDDDAALEMAELAAAAAQQLHRPSLPPSMTLLSASVADRVAAGAGDVPYIFVLGCPAACLGVTAGAWELALTVTVCALVYSLIEPTTGRSLGKRMLDLRLVAEPGAAAGALWSRWALKNAPVLVMTVVCLGGLLGIGRGGVDPEWVFAIRHARALPLPDRRAAEVRGHGIAAGL
jgi:hypothetical protein